MIPSIDFAALTVTRGILMPAEEASAASENPGEVTIRWTSDVELGSASPDDEAVILLYNTTEDRVLYIVEGEPRRNEEAHMVTLPKSHQGATLQVYLSLVTAGSLS